MKNQLADEETFALIESEANLESLVEQVQKSKRPLILMHDSESKAVLLNIEDYQTLLEELEVLRDIHVAEEQLRNGQFISNREARKRLLGR